MTANITEKTKGTTELTESQLQALRAIASFGSLGRLMRGQGVQRVTLAYMAPDGRHYSRMTINALVQKGYAQRTGGRSDYIITLTNKGKASMRTSLGDYWCGKLPQKKALPGQRNLTDEEIKSLRLVASHDALFWDDESRTYKPLVGDGEVTHSMAQRMARFVWVALDTKTRVSILPNGLRAAEAGVVAIE